MQNIQYTPTILKDSQRELFKLSPLRSDGSRDSQTGGWTLVRDGQRYSIRLKSTQIRYTVLPLTLKGSSANL